jgi:hypothetical protein
MSADRTPRTSTVRAGWSQGHPFRLITEPEERYAEFDRWLASVKADAWRLGFYKGMVGNIDPNTYEGVDDE